jgi:hypothetical protein
VALRGEKDVIHAKMTDRMNKPELTHANHQFLATIDESFHTLQEWDADRLRAQQSGYVRLVHSLSEEAT